MRFDLNGLGLAPRAASCRSVDAGRGRGPTGEAGVTAASCTHYRRPYFLLALDDRPPVARSPSSERAQVNRRAAWFPDVALTETGVPRRRVDLVGLLDPVGSTLRATVILPASGLGGRR
jgi:hypothetical protein